MIKIEGKAGISAIILADSVNEKGDRLTTFELVYPRIVHAELLTHGMLVRNAASSRAIPFKKMVEQLTARPVRFGQANPGMQDKGVDFNAKVEFFDNDFGYGVLNSLDPFHAWGVARDNAVRLAKGFAEAGYHKQVYNRLLEPFQMMKTVLSCTEYANFNWLRNDGAADPTLEELAKVMAEARKQSKPVLLKAGEYHLPYVRCQNLTWSNGDKERVYTIDEYFKILDCGGKILPHLTLEQAIKVSCARCAAVSFRNEDYGLEKCLEVYDRLIGDERKHASAMQHVATPMIASEEGLINDKRHPITWEKGISHTDREGNLWSAQFKGWIMWRKTIDGENYTGEES